MHYEGTVNIAAEREKVWAFLTDADFVSQCAPGIKAMEIVVPNEKYLAVASIGFGSVVVEFKAHVEFLELKEPDFAKVTAHGDASDSAVDVTSEMHLSKGLNGSTDLAWSAEIVVLGKIASVAARMMGSVTKKLTNQFFECVKDQIEA